MGGYDPMNEGATTHNGNQGQGQRPRRSRETKPAAVRQTTQGNGKNARRKARKEPVFMRIMNFCRDRRTHYGIGVTLIILALAMLAVLISFLKNGTADQSAVAGQSIAQIANSAESVGNAGGAFGAKLAHWLIVDTLGLSTMIIAGYVGCIGLMLVGLIKIRIWPFTFKCLFSAVALSVILGLFTYNSESYINWGGNHGHYVNQWIMHYADALGAYVVTLILIGILASIYLNQIIAAWRAASDSAHSLMAAQAERARRRKADLAPFEAETGKSNEPLQPSVQLPVANDAGSADIAANNPEETHTDGRPNAQNTPPNKNMNLPELADLPETEFVINSPASEPSGDEKSNKQQASDPMRPYDHRAELSRYVFPSIDLLKERDTRTAIDAAEQQENKDLIIRSLQSYGIEISRIEATIGPTVTLYEIVPAEGIRIAQIKRLEEDIQMSLAALGIRIIAPIPGKGTIGIEVPNRDPQTVSFRSVINSRKFRECNMTLPMALGATISNDVFVADLTKMPHLLVAGATGQGKSVGLNCIIASLLYKKHPTELKFVLVDPKMVEFSLYAKLSHHYLAKLPDEENAIITDTSKVVPTLNSLCVLMDSRYELLMQAGVRSLEEYNVKFTQRRLNPEKGHCYMPYIVVVVDEFADLIATAGKDVLMYISRIAAKARAVGIHMIIATQRPSTDVITGVIKANFPGRIAFKVSAMVDSRTILDAPGANRLIGRGDMLFSHNSKLDRVQCAFIDTDEVEAIAEHIDNQIGFETDYLLPEPASDSPGGASSVPGRVDLSQRDELFDDCARFVVQNATASTSSLQRRFAIGYNKAGKIMDQMEAAGIVGPADGARPRQVLFTSDQLEDFLRNS